MISDKKSLILIVDDNPQNLQFAAQLIQKNGFDVAVSQSAAQALLFLQKHLPDLILLDVMMPDMNGYEMCEKIKKNKNMQHIPVIFLTAKAEEEDIVTGFEKGGIDYVTKPFKAAELIARVKTHVELKRARDEIKMLRGIIPVCANCKNVRDENNEWQTMEQYILSHSEADISHTLCKDCLKILYPDVYEKIKNDV